MLLQKENHPSSWIEILCATADEIIEKILQQKTFNQGFMTTELLAAAILDMNLHAITRCYFGNQVKLCILYTSWQDIHLS